MYTLLLIIYSLLILIGINTYLWTNYIYILVFSIFLFIYIISVLIKTDIEILLNILAKYVLFLLLLGVYIFSYSNISLKENKYTFLEENALANYLIDRENNSKKVYEECLLDNLCNIKKIYEDNFNNVQGLINAKGNSLNLSNIDLALNKLIQNKKYLKENGVTINKKLYFNKNNITISFLKKKKINNEEYFTMRNNLFINKEQYFNYSYEYYYKLYNLIISDNIEGIEELKIYYSRNNLLKVFINRKYLYNFLITSPELMHSKAKMIKQIEKKVAIYNN